MFTVTVETKTAIHVITECTSYWYNADSDTLKICRNYGKEIICIPYHEILHYTIKGK